MSPGASWLRERLPDAPEALLEAMCAAVPDRSSVPESLADGAIALYQRVVRGRGGREDALPLLAADALFTHAFEAQAALAPAELAASAARWRQRLGEVIS